MTFSFEKFMHENNEIEGISRPGAFNSHEQAEFAEQVSELQKFIGLKQPTVSDLIRLAEVFEPSAKIRDQRGMDVIVGNHRPPMGGQFIVPSLENMLGLTLSPYTIYCFYETLYPFTDSNGRTGRALWLWAMSKQPGGLANVVDSSFFKTFHYQALDHYREK